MAHVPKIVTKTVDYSNPYMSVIKQVMRFSDGREKSYYVLDRKNDFSIIIPLFDDQTTVLVGQYRIPVRSFSWEYPMGTVYNKTPLQVAKQELREETGILAKRFIKIGSFHVSPGYSKQMSHVFIAIGLTQGEPQPEEFEHLTVKKTQLHDVKNMIKNGTIKDGPTIVANSFLTDYLT